MSYVTTEQLQELVSYMASHTNMPTIGVGGGYAPVGTVISYIGTTAPYNFLICDGTVYNITDYPQLADTFETQLGAKNYFGGDGIDTFAVPDLSGGSIKQIDVLYCIKAVSENTYSTEERPVGTWIDGKTIYQKTIQVTTPSKASAATDIYNLTSLNIDTFIDMFGWIYDGSTTAYPVQQVGLGTQASMESAWYSGNSIRMWLGNANRINSPCIITILYTKTTD